MCEEEVNSIDAPALTYININLSVWVLQKKFFFFLSRFPIMRLPTTRLTSTRQPVVVKKVGQQISVGDAKLPFEVITRRRKGLKPKASPPPFFFNEYNPIALTKGP